MAWKNKQEIITMIFCIFIAFVLWIYVMGEQNPTQTRVIEDIPVYFTNLDNLEQNNLTIVPNQTFTVNLTITGRAMDVFKAKPEDFRLEADLGGYVKKGVNNIPVEVKSMPKGISVLYERGIPYVKVKIDSLLEKTVPVSLNITGQPKEGYGYANPNIKPSEVLIRGPETYVAKAIGAVINIDLSKRDTDFSASLPIKVIDSYGDSIQYLSVEPKYIDVYLPIKPSKEVPVIVKTKGEIPDNKVLNSINPMLTSVKIIGEKEIIDTIDYIETEPIDLSKINLSTYKDIKLIIPEGISLSNNTKSITVDIKVENKIEKSMSLDIEILNVKNDFEYIVSPSKINVTVVGAESVINSIKADSTFAYAIKAYVDVSDKQEGEYQLPIKLDVPHNLVLKKQSISEATVKINKK
ncbi:MAG: CdaR family protein [Caloramator sp.]|nr:CdaR family protein [Caloramator sp.]